MDMLRTFAVAQLMLCALQCHCFRVKQSDLVEESGASSPRKKKHNEVPLSDSSFFGGLRIKHGPDAWARDVSDDLWTTVTAEVDDVPVFDALYNHVNAVSDIVAYEIGFEDFKVGGGRGSGWKEDETLQLAYDGQRSEYATRTDYSGVGHFKIDRGHQCPVGSFNALLEKADKTNMPSNLSPQSVELNQKKWRYLEADIRDKASSDYLTMADESDMYAHVLTGPLYQLPEAFFVSGESEDIEAGKEKWDAQMDAWCQWEKEETVDDHRWIEGELEAYETHKGKSWIECVKMDSAQPLVPNNLWMDFHAKPKATPLRVPLGYFKIIVIPAGTRADLTQHQYCAFIMDQTGQCMLTNLESLSDVAYLDFSKTHLIKEDHRVASPYFCLPPGGVLRERNACAYFHKKDINEVTDEEVITWRMKELESDPL